MTNQPTPISTDPLDCLAIGAHPDDAELFAGGTLALAARLSRRVGILDLTRGEAATRGTPEIRAREAAEAARILGVSVRQTLDLGDGRLADTPEARRTVIEAIRHLRPRLVLTHAGEDRHPDHRHAHALVRDAAFLAGVGGYPAAGARWRVEALAFFPGNEFQGDIRADWVIDVGAAFEAKLAALRAYATQFLSNGDGDPALHTYIASPEFWDHLQQRAALWGHRIGAAQGEPFLLDRPAHARHPLVELLRGRL
ncbi:MAG: bacillithiol biosynthesis deacetylase BshB1 [bacterium]|nr:bacillithiol biosynthesis deacetylase BshB1 [bacterium]